MALNAREDNVLLREWAPLTDLFQKLPTKTHTSIFNNDLKLTCVDVIPEFIALGTNCGIVYCYDRKKKDLQRLRCENEKSAVTVIKIISTVDYMLACGNKDGNISIFQIPKAPPANLPESLRPKNKQVERYTVSEMHKGSISAMEWSKNGMKLFSGDSNGFVVLTEIDFYMHLCKSVEILNEAYEVVQLSYYQQQLLISTTYRSIVCQKQEKWKVCQVGKKDRKVLGKFGGIFYQNGLRPTDVVLYCSRPGLRIWVSDIKGAVQKTLLFKDILNLEFPEVPILNPLSTNLKRLKPNKEASFGTIMPFSEDLLVTYNNDVVYVLNTKEMKIVATVSHLRGVLNVSACKDEIFILEGERSLVRVAFSPESMTDNSTPSPSTPSPMGFIPLNSIKDLTNKIQSTKIIPAIPSLYESNKAKEHQEEVIITNAEEAREAPLPFSFLNKYKSCEQTYTDKVYEAYKRIEVYNKISEQDFDDTILFKHGRRKKPDMAASMCSSMSSNSSEEKEARIVKPTVMNISTVGLLPDLRSPDSIHNDIIQKEKMLADILNFDNVKVDMARLDELKNCDIVQNGTTDLKRNNCDNTLVLSKCADQSEPKEVKCYDEKCDTEILSEKHNVLIDEINESKSEEKKLKKEAELKELQNVEELISNKCDINAVKNDVPVCRTMPENWKVFQLSLTENNEVADTTLSDWEII